MYIITGATGNTGKPIALALLNAGKKVRVVSRNADKVADLTEKGAEALIGDINDPSFLEKAFEGVEAAYVMIPPNFGAENFRAYQSSLAESFALALEKNKVKYVVTLSSVGAHLPEKAGVVQGLYDMEQRFNKISGLNVLHLRPTYFMENLLGNIPMIKHMGVMGSPLKGDMPFPMVATKDIAEVATKRLLDLNFQGNSAEYILGPRDVTYNEVAGILGKAIGKNDLKYMEFPSSDARKAMIEQWGLTPSAADAMLEFQETMNAGKITEDAKRTPANSSPTSVEDFASHTFTYVYNM